MDEEGEIIDYDVSMDGTIYLLSSEKRRAILVRKINEHGHWINVTDENVLD